MEFILSPHSMIQILGLDNRDIKKSFDEEIDHICKRRCRNTKDYVCADLCHTLADELPLIAAYRTGVEVFENLGFSITKNYDTPRNGLVIDIDNTDWSFLASQFYDIGLCNNEIDIPQDEWIIQRYHNNPKKAVLANISKFIPKDFDCLPRGVPNPDNHFQSELLGLLNEYSED